MTDASQPADPVSEPDAYRRYLLGALGDDDPALVQAATPARLRALIDEAGDLVRVRPEPAEWSALECIGHITDSELIVAARVRWILAEDAPDLVGYDQAAWVEGLRHRDDEPAALLALFAALRDSNLDLWARRPEDRHRFGIHRERGRESWDLLFRLAAGHDRVHLDQARRALDAVRENRAASPA